MVLPTDTLPAVRLLTDERGSDAETVPFFPAKVAAMADELSAPMTEEGIRGSGELHTEH